VFKSQVGVGSGWGLRLNAGFGRPAEPFVGVIGEPFSFVVVHPYVLIDDASTMIAPIHVTQAADFAPPVTQCVLLI
jgi:hypothetical protein